MAGPRCPGAWCFRRCGSGAYTMRPYNEKGGRCVCRGGFHIRPCRPPIPAAPPPNAVGTAINRPCRPPISNPPPPNAVGAAISRPNTPPIPAAPPPSLVGRHAHMPPWPGSVDRKPGNSGGTARAAIKAAPTRGPAAGCDGCGPGGSGGPGLAGCGHPALRTGSLTRRRGGLYGRPCRPPISNAPPPNAVGTAISRPNTPPIPAAPPPSLVGRHAHMPPWPGRDAREPGASGGAVRAHIQCAPTTRRVAGASVGADFISARAGLRFSTHPRRTP